ncbi:MAG: hypothetical protein PHU40_06540, partial [Sulfurimonas sp.]|nr:hypothetical protein [Sulfurimonas sp.]
LATLTANVNAVPSPKGTYPQGAPSPRYAHSECKRSSIPQGDFLATLTANVNAVPSPKGTSSLRSQRM